MGLKMVFSIRILIKKGLKNPLIILTNQLFNVKKIRPGIFKKSKDISKNS